MGGISHPQVVFRMWSHHNSGLTLRWVPGYLPHCAQQCNFWSYRSPWCVVPCNCHWAATKTVGWVSACNKRGWDFVLIIYIYIWFAFDVWMFMVDVWNKLPPFVVIVIVRKHGCTADMSWTLWPNLVSPRFINCIQFPSIAQIPWHFQGFLFRNRSCHGSFSASVASWGMACCQCCCIKDSEIVSVATWNVLCVDGQNLHRKSSPIPPERDGMYEIQRLGLIVGLHN